MLEQLKELDPKQIFYDKIALLNREELLEVIRQQNPQYMKDIERVEWVFRNMLSHITDDNGNPIEERDLTESDLRLLIDPPFIYSQELAKRGYSEAVQRQVHIASDPILWAKTLFGFEPRIYQTLILRDPNHKKVLRLGRRMGKTTSMAIYALWRAYTGKEERVLVLTPMMSHAKVIFEEILKWADENEVIKEEVKNHVRSPQFEIKLQNKSTIRFFSTGMKSGGKCLTPDHDVLTENGWKSIAEVQEGEMIATVQDGMQKFVPVEDKHSYEYDGDIIEHSGKQLSFRATPNHRFLTRTHAPNSPWRFKMAGQLGNYNQIPTNGIPEVGTTKEFSGDELELWGWWLSEGGGCDGNMAKICQTKPSGRQRIIEVIESLGLHYRAYQREIRVKWCPPIYSGKNAYDKFIPRELLTEYNRQRLLDGLLGGDGWIRRDGWEYSSSSYQLAEDVQELAIRLGLRANIRPKKITYEPVGGGDPNPHWITSAYPKQITHVNSALLKTVHYKGDVHCVSVQTGVFLTRHNGLIHITGNSNVARGQEADVIILDEMDYMGAEDLVAIYIMIQDTNAKKMRKKALIGASTPSGLRESFWEWSTDKDRKFSAYWFPAYCNPMWSADMEADFRKEYKKEIDYRHEVEADWGEAVDGVYKRSCIDRAHSYGEWTWNDLDPRVYMDSQSEFIMGVDWDKVGAGVNIVVLEVCGDGYVDRDFAGKVKVVFREEIDKGSFTYSEAVKRIVQLNELFDFSHIYVDRGSGEMQLELLHQYGIDNPETGLHLKVQGFQFAENILVRDPYTQLESKKRIKSFMVDNLYRMLEEDRIVFSGDDDELYFQLISYITVRTSAYGEPVFGAGGSAVDHAHDALILACLAFAQNFDHLLKPKYGRKSRSVSSDAFMTQRSDIPGRQLGGANKYDYFDELPENRNKKDTFERVSLVPKRSMTGMRGRNNRRVVQRKMF